MQYGWAGKQTTTTKKNTSASLPFRVGSPFCMLVAQTCAGIIVDFNETQTSTIKIDVSTTTVSSILITWVKLNYVAQSTTIQENSTILFHLTIRLRAQVFYEQIARRKQGRVV